MADKRINKDDIADKGLFDHITQGAKAAQAEIKTLTLTVNTLKQAAQGIKKGLGGASVGNTQGMKDFDQLAKQANQTAKAKLAIDKDILREKEKLRVAQQQQNKEIREEVALANSQKGSLERVRLESKKLRNEKEKLDLTTKKGNQRLKVVNKTLDRNNKILERNATKLGKQKMAIGRYKNALGGLKNALGQLGVAFGVFSLIKDSFNVIKDFQQAQANLASVLGVNVDQMKALTNQAKELGATTRFTASQVSELQLELAKLGFTQQQINDMTPATLALAEATGTELANAAAVAGSTLNGFGLAAKDTQRVVDVMAKSFSSSSLDMEKFKVGMAAVAPVAKTMGFSIEQTTAMLGSLTDSGLDASTAGTSLRNMMLEASKQGLTWKEALDKVNNAQDKAGVALELFGKRGVAAGVILAENQDKVAGLTDKLEDAEGAAAKMADTQRNTLGGALDLLRSSWEGLILSMDEAGGVGETLRKGIKFLADNLGTIVTVIIKAVRAFLAFKTVMFALKMNQQFKDWKAFGGSVKDVGKNMDQASSGARKFAKSLKRIGIGVAVALFTEFVAALWNIVSGASAAADQLERLQNIRKDGEEDLRLFNKAFKVQLENRRDLLDESIAAAERKRKQDLENGKDRIKVIEEEKEAIKAANDEYLLWLNRKDPLGRDQIELLSLRIEGAQNAIMMAENELSLNEKEKNKAVRDIRRFRIKEEILASKNSLKLLKSEIAQRRAALEALEPKNETKTEGRLIKPAGKADETPEKQISLLREIRDEQLKQIADVEEQEVLVARESAARIIEDKNLTNASDKDKAEFTKEINESLVLEITAIRKKFRDADLEAERVHQEEIAAIVLEAKDSELAQINDMFAVSRQERELLLLQSGKTEKEIARELTEFEIEQLEKRIQVYKDMLTEFPELEKEITGLEIELLKKKRSLIDKEIDWEKEKFKTQKDAIDLTTQLFIDSIDKKIAKLDEEVEAHKKRADDLEELAKNGNITAKESLAEENRLIAEAEAQKAELEKRKQRIQMVSSILLAYNSNLEQGDESGVALAKAISSKAVLEQFISSIGSFYDGTEDTGRVGNALDSKGGRFAVLHDNERVMTAKQNSMMGNVSNDEVARVMEDRRLGRLVDGNQVAVGWENIMLVEQLNNVSDKLDMVNKTIENKPETNIQLGAITQKTMEIVESRKKGGLKTVSTFKVKPQ